MTHQKGQRRERRATEVRQAQIVDAAMHIIACRGARRFTANLLGAEVGVTGGAIFRHFKTMDAIVDAVVGRMEEILFEGFPPDAADPIERLGTFFQNRVRAIVANPHVSRMLFSDHLAQAGGKAQERRIEGFKRRSRDFIAGCLLDARKSGLLLGEAGPEEGTILIMGSIFALAHSQTRVPDPKQIESLSRKVWVLIESALRGKITRADSLHRLARPAALAAGRARIPKPNGRPDPIGPRASVVGSPSGKEKK